MPCDFCHPDVHDHGFDLSDERGRWTVHDPSCWAVSPPSEEEEAALGFGADPTDCSEGEGCGTVTIRVEREWFECACGHGTDYRCSFVVSGPGGVSARLRSMASAERFVAAEWPTAATERDDAWESERWLRYAETGVMG